MRSARTAFAVAGACLFGSSSAGATLSSDLDVLAGRYRAEGAEVSILPVRFLGPGASLPIAFAAVPERDCTTVTVLSAPSTVFVLKVPRRDAPLEIVPSAAGAATIVLCGASRNRLSSLTIEMRSPHGIIETIVATSAAPLTAPKLALAHRDPGPVPHLERPGPSPSPAPLAVRADALTDLYRREGAEDVDRRFVPADSRGAGRLLIRLEPGCHRIAVLGVSSGDEGSFRDVDAQLTWASGDTADADRAESPDATLEACNGERGLAMLSFAGASPEVPVLVLRATIALPAGIPEVFGPEGRARIGKALLARRGPRPAGPPLEAWLGVQGATRLPFELTPGQCYLVAIAPVRGVAKLLTLEASLGAGASRAHTADGDGGVAIVACARAERRAYLEVQGHGAGLVWGALVWPLSRLRLGEEQQ